MNRKVAVIVEFSECGHNVEFRKDFRNFLVSFPAMDDEAMVVSDEIAAERAQRIPREVELAE